MYRRGKGEIYRREKGGEMYRKPITGTRIGAWQLRHLLQKCADNKFRERLISDPEKTLRTEGLRADPHWLRFFGSLAAANFENRMTHQIDSIDIQEGEGEAEAEADAEDQAEAEAEAEAKG